MFRKVILPILAIAGVCLALWTVLQGSKPIPSAKPVTQPAHAPFASYVAAAGIIESSTENIAVGTPVAGVVTDVYVKVGSDVKAGDPLFKIDDRELQAQLQVRQAALATERQQLERLKSLPRPEEIPTAEARVKEAKAAYEDARVQYQNWQRIEDPHAVSAEEMSRRKYAVEAADAKVKEAESDLALLKAGSWTPDIEIAQAETAAAQAQVDQTKIDIDRLTVRAPVNGRVLQVKIRKGEYAPSGVLQTPLMLVGNVDRLHVRVDVDENDAWRVKPGSEAIAYVRGNRELHTPLTFVQVEPYVVPKRSLTGESTERVDTRVLQVIYSFDAETLPVYVGQQMDVFIEAPGLAK